MNDFMRTILSRVLSEEIGKQERWANKELAEFGTPIDNRMSNIAEIKKYMQENGIDFRQDFYESALYV